MIEPTSMNDILHYQKHRLELFDKETCSEATIYIEKFILDVLVEHSNLIKNKDGNVHVTMSPDRFRLIEKMYPKKFEDSVV